MMNLAKIWWCLIFVAPQTFHNLTIHHQWLLSKSGVDYCPWIKNTHFCLFVQPFLKFIPLAPVLYPKSYPFCLVFHFHSCWSFKWIAAHVMSSRAISGGTWHWSAAFILSNAPRYQSVLCIFCYICSDLFEVLLTVCRYFLRDYQRVYSHFGCWHDISSTWSVSYIHRITQKFPYWALNISWFFANT